MYAEQNYIVNPDEQKEDDPDKKKKETPKHRPEVIILEDNRERRDGPGGN